VREGFYKVEFSVDGAAGRSVMYVHAGKMLGGNSAFAHYGTYHEIDGETVAEVTSHRHHDDSSYKSLLGADIARIDVRGGPVGKAFHFKGSSPQMPGAVVRSVMTPLEEETFPAVGPNGENGIVEGLYSVHIRTLDGVNGSLTGVMLLYEGRILGGDAFFYYLGSYASANGRWRGGIVNQEHTPAKEAHPIFGGYEVGIGFSGSYSSDCAELEATALVGKRSIRLKAVLKLMRRMV
jgi:hypothetical protein